MSVDTAGQVAAVLVMLPMLWVVVWIGLGFSRPSAVLVAEGFQMWVLAPSWAIAALSAWAGWWWALAPATVVALAHGRWCLVAVHAERAPAWVPGAETFTLFAANVLYVNRRPDAMASTVCSVDADVVVLNETTRDLRERLAACGARAAYPHRLSTDGRPFDETIWSRLPAADLRIEVLGGQWVPAVTVEVGGQRVRVFAVHTKAPKDAAARASWHRNLSALGESARSAGDVAHVYAGDFNAAPWHGPFRKLRSSGLRSCHDLVGAGLSRSWTPRSRWLSWLGPVMRLDHVLTDDRLFPVSVRDVVVPGSDHRGVVVTLAVRPPE